MKIKNRSGLLALARKQKYTGPADLVKLKAWLSEELIELVNEDGEPIDVDAVWAVKAVVGADADPGDEDDSDNKTKAVEITEAQAEEYRTLKKQAVQAARGKGAPKLGGEGGGKVTDYARVFEVKSFNAKAAMGQTRLPDADTAEVIGAWAKLVAAGPYDFDGKKLCQEICQKANVSYDFSSGGFVIPEVLRSTLISIRPAYSALDQLVATTPIAPQGESVPRRTGGVTVYSPAEGVAATESNPSGDQVKMTPFEMVALTTVSRTQMMRSNIDFGEFVANEMVYALKKKMEEIYFKGDGSSTYFNQVGLLGKAAAQVVAAGGTWTIGTNATNAEYHSACVRGAGNLWSELTYQNHCDVVARGAANVENPGSLAWACNSTYFHSTMVPIAQSKGGVTTAEVINGVPSHRFLGYPVVFTNALPAAPANGSVVAWFGDFNTCTKVGEVPGAMAVESNPHRYWDQRKIGYQTSTHKAVNCHDLGTANSTQPDQSVPMAFLVTAES